MARPHSQVIPEIQGLRAVAVLSVLVYHIWPALLPGGYVGVDVFFVISGYLITGSLLKEFETTGGINIAGFYARRIRRLLPASTVVSLAVALSMPLFLRERWPEIASSLVASALYVQNWFLAAQAVNYLADEAKGPMNHFWSLSVEEQYYIVWPLVVLPVLGLAGRARLNARKAFAWTIGLIGATSLAYSVYLTPVDPGVAYFATTTRAWELALGGGLAVLKWRHVFSERLRGFLGLMGLGAIVAACLAYSGDTRFPGYAGLLPTLGSAAVIVASGAQAPWSARFLLNSSPARYFGDISYSLYLWHWPLVVVHEELTGRPAALLDGAAILIASCALAHFSKIHVEDRFRTVGLPTGRTIAAGVGAVASILVNGIGFLIQVPTGSDGAFATGLPCGASALVDPQYDWRQENLARIVPRPENVKKDVPSSYANGCHQNQRRTEVKTCDFGAPGSPVHVVMIGDSHATHWFPTFEEIARRRPIYFQGMAKSACLFSLEPVYYPPLKRLYTECSEWSNNVINRLARDKPDLVLISQSPAYSADVADGVTAAWERLIRMGLDVRFVRSTPWTGLDPAKCLLRSERWVKECAPVRAAVFRSGPAEIAAEKLKVQSLDFSDYFCDAAHCPMVLGGVLVYRDSHHMSATFARTLGNAMEKRLPLDPEQ